MALAPVTAPELDRLRGAEGGEGPAAPHFRLPHDLLASRFLGFFLVSRLTCPVHSAPIITRLAWGGGGGGGRRKLYLKAASVLKTRILEPEALPQRHILSECGSVGLFLPLDSGDEQGQVAS